MQKPEALIFDVDGTLADTERDGHRVAYNKTFASLGIDWHWSVEHYGHLLQVTGGKERCRFHAEECDPDFLAQADVDAQINKIYAAKSVLFQNMLGQGGIALRSGVKRLLLEARQAGVTLAVATTTHPGNVTSLLEAQLGEDAPGWFAVIAAGDMVANKKPAPDIYQLALETMGLQASQCLAFEDSRNGLQSAMQAGLKTVVTLNDYTRKQNMQGAALVLDQLGDPDCPAEVLHGAMQESCFSLATAANLLAS